MGGRSAERIDWAQLWASGDLARFCFISLGIMLHATNETMVATIMPSMVGDLSGLEMVGWSLSIYELGSIIAGAAAGRLVSYIPLRTNMMAAAFIYALGAALCAAAPTMPVFLAGRMVEGLGGGALVSLAFVSVERLFPQRIWPQLFGIISAVWGVSAFSGPLLGAVISQSLSWRWAFAIFACGGVAMAATALFALRGPAATARPTEAAPAPFPVAVLACLAASVMLISYAGVEISLWRSAPLLAAGLAGLVLFFVADARNPRVRLFPARLFDWRSPLGCGMTMFAAFSIGTVAFSLYGPLLLTSLHGVPLLTTGYIIAAESISWSVLSILVATAQPARERLIVVTGALMIATAMAGFAIAVPAGNLPAILGCAILQGGGFGVAWPFVTRIIVAAARPEDRTVASSAVPTISRMGYAVGAALSGIIANAGGFSRGLTSETAATVSVWLFAGFLPLGLLGVAAAAWLMRAPRTTQADAG